MFFSLLAALSTGYLRRMAHVAQGREVMYLKVINALPIGIWVRAKSGKTIFVNERWASFSDHSAEEIMSADLLDPPVDLGSDWEKQAEQLMQSEDAVTYYQSIDLVDRHGTHCSLTLFTLPMYLDELAEIGLLCLLVDETAVRLYEERVRVSQDRLSMALAAAEVGFWDRDLTTGQVYVDENCYRILGMKRAEVPNVGQAWTEHIHPDDRARVLALYEQVLSEGTQLIQMDYRIQGSSKDYIWVQDRTGVIERNQAGVPIRMMGVIEDISLRKDTENELQDARDKAQLASEAKGHFLATISHEIRTPLNAIIGLSSFLSDTDLDEEQRDLAQTIYSSGKGLLLLVNDILDFSKIEAGRVDLEAQEYPLRLCFEDSIKLFKLKAAEKKLQLELAMDSDISDFAFGDMERLRQVIHNLLDNAIKFTETGGVQVAVRKVELSDLPEAFRPDPIKTIGYLDMPDHGYIEIAVHDTGIGVPENRRSMLFQSFSQVESSMTRKYGGTGLGLAICRRLVEAMGGEIWLDSESGEGTTFRFFVRIKFLRDERELECGKPTRSPFDPVQRIAEEHPCDILVVGDCEEAKRTLLACRKLGYVPHHLRAYEQYDRNRLRRRCNIVFVSVDMDGQALELSRQLQTSKELGSDQHIVGLVAQGSTVSAQRCKLAGMQRVVADEIHSEVIRSVILDVLCASD